MAKASYDNITRPVRKRSAVTGTLVGVRLQVGQIEAIDAWAAKQVPPVTRPEAIRGMIDAMLHILSKDTGEKPAKKAKKKVTDKYSAEVPNMSQRAVMQHLSLDDWKIVAHLPIPVGEMMVSRIRGYGWIESRHEEQHTALRLTPAGLKALRSAV
jgi:hypothetical protein